MPINPVRSQITGRSRSYLGFVLLAAVCAQCQPSNPGLAAQIEQLLQKEFSDQAPDPATLSKVRQIFGAYSIPAADLVGLEAAEDYIVLAAHDQPVSFLQRVLPVLKTAVDNEKVPMDSYVYLSARLRQKQVESSIGEPGNAKLRDEIERLFRIDQSVRQRSNFDATKMKQVDMSNLVRERAIFANYGVPGYSMVGPRATKDFIVLVEHQPLEFMQQVLPKLKHSVDAGQADPSDYASMFDRVQTGEQKPQRYGMNFVCTPEGKLAPAPIEDGAHLEQRRAEMGLLPMRLYTRLVVENSPKGFCEKIASDDK